MHPECAAACGVCGRDGLPPPSQPAARAQAQIGTVQDVIIDGPSDEAGEWLARSKADAPEIDGVVYLKSDTALKPGDIVSAKINDADAYDLYGDAV